MALATLVAALVIGVPVALAAAPANDNFAAAQAIPSDGLAVGSNLDATAETGEPNHAASSFGDPFHSIWYSWTPSGDGSATINTCGSAFDTRLAVYTGSSVDALTEVTSNDDASAGGACPGSKFSEVVFSAVAGTSYKIAIDTNGDLAGDGSGPPQGEVRLALSGPGIGPDPEPGPEPTPDPEPTPEPQPGGETETTTPGTPFPISSSGVLARMPDLEPKQKTDKRGKTKVRFSTIVDANEEIGTLNDQGLNTDLKLKTIPLIKFPKAQEDAIEANPRDGGQILRTSPAPGEPLGSTIETPQVIRIQYWDPAKDKRYLKKLEKQAEQRRKEEEARKQAEKDKKEKRCKLLDFTNTGLDLLLQAKTYEEAAKEISSYKNCLPTIDKSTTNSRILRDYVVGTSKNEKRNAIGLEIVRPRVPDFTLTWREDPAKIADADQLSLVTEADGDWVLPRSSKSTSRITIQVNERLTGRFVAGADLSIVNANNGKELLRTKTDGSGEKTITFKLPQEAELVIGATYGSGAEQMSAYRSLMVKEQGRQMTTVCGRTLTLKNGTYRGSQADLDRCRGLKLAPANLGDGRATVTSPRIPAIEQTTGLAPNPDGSGELLLGQYNAVSITGSNTIVAAAPGIIATGGGNLIGQAGGNSAPAETRAAAKLRRAGFFGAIGDLFNNLVTNVSRAFNQNVSNIKKVLQPGQAQAAAQTAQTLAQNNAAVPPQTTLSPKGVGVISTGGGNLIGQAGGNIIATGGGNLISDKGLGLIGQAGGNVISTGGLNLMPVNGGQIITDQGAG